MVGITQVFRVCGSSRKEVRFEIPSRLAFLFDEDHAGRERVRAQKEIDEQAALGVRMKEKAEEFLASGGEIYPTN